MLTARPEMRSILLLDDVKILSVQNYQVLQAIDERETE